MRKPRILLDCDGVLTTSFVDRVCEILRANNHDAHPHHIEQWDIMKHFKIPKHAEETIYEKMEQKGVAFDFEPAPGAVEFVRELHTWADVYVVTSPMGGKHWPHDRQRWLKHWFDIPANHVLNIKHKFVVKGDVLVDDKLSNLTEWHMEFPQGTPIFWRLPQNRHDKHPYLEASNFDELRKHLHHEGEL